MEWLENFFCNPLEKKLSHAQKLDRNSKTEYVTNKPPANNHPFIKDLSEQYIPKGVEEVKPGVCPWSAITIPWREGQKSPQGGVFDNGKSTSENYHMIWHCMVVLIKHWIMKK
jgi:hypothetical protein